LLDKNGTWNPVTGCTPVSAGCDNCWAAAMARRFKQDFAVTMHPDRLGKIPGGKGKRIFVCNTGDLFHEAVTDGFIWDVFMTMANTPQHKFLVLTKRPKRMAKVMPNISWALPDRLEHVWLGTSVEDQATLDARVLWLLKTPAAVRYVSYEPALGPVDFRKYWDYYLTERLDWVICGGESGPKARPMNPDWARKVRDDCKAAGVAFWFKQWGQFAPDYDWLGDNPLRHPSYLKYANTIQRFTVTKAVDSSQLGKIRYYAFDEKDRAVLMRKHRSVKQAGRLLDGREWNQLPEDLLVRELPE